MVGTIPQGLGFSFLLQFLMVFEQPRLQNDLILKHKSHYLQRFDCWSFFIVNPLTKASYCHPRLKKALNYAIINKSKIERMSPMKNFRDDIKVNDLAQPFLEPIVEQMTTVFDPEIELDIYNLGLIYEITIDENGHCYFLMTFTDTGCGCEETMPYEIAEKLKSIDGINSVKVETTYSPVWKMTRISRYGRIALGISPRGGK